MLYIHTHTHTYIHIARVYLVITITLQAVSSLCVHTSQCGYIGTNARLSLRVFCVYKASYILNVLYDLLIKVYFFYTVTGQSVVDKRQYGQWQLTIWIIWAITINTIQEVKLCFSSVHNLSFIVALEFSPDCM